MLGNTTATRIGGSLSDVKNEFVHEQVFSPAQARRQAPVKLPGRNHFAIMHDGSKGGKSQSRGRPAPIVVKFACKPEPYIDNARLFFASLPDPRETPGKIS
jgi:hypothetical protein